VILTSGGRAERRPASLIGKKKSERGRAFVDAFSHGGFHAPCFEF
jgi:hypothetical protein